MRKIWVKIESRTGAKSIARLDSEGNLIMRGTKFRPKEQAELGYRIEPVKDVSIVRLNYSDKKIEFRDKHGFNITTIPFIKDQITNKDMLVPDIVVLKGVKNVLATDEISDVFFERNVNCYLERTKQEPSSLNLTCKLD